MRIRNKEIRRRRHRKEQRVKALLAEAKSAPKDGRKRAPKTAEPKPVPAPKAEPKEKAAAKPRTPRAKKTDDESAAPKKRTRAKKAED